ncbi:MAG: hypothetical protein M3512_01715 [Bacteroidota bacterium]|nr:hypothetical protein [Bacteroidota bacterium]
MALIKAVSTFLFFITIILLFLGLYKPWVVLWWKSKANREGVIKVYGMLLVLFAIILALLKEIEQ